MPFNSSRKTIYKGVDSTIGFEVKNQDRKPVNLLGKTVMVHLMQVRTGTLLLQRRAVVDNSVNGFCEFTIYGSDLTETAPGLYQISAVIYDSDGISRSLYTDHNRSATMEVEIVDGAYPKYIPSTEVVFSQIGDQYESQPIASNLQKNDFSTLHTIQISVTNFTGTIRAQASLEYDSMGHYSSIKFIDDSSQLTFNNTTGVQGWNFKANARWIKLIYTPAETNTGTVDRIIYRS
jgi:hypothetical protein